MRGVGSMSLRGPKAGPGSLPHAPHHHPPPIVESGPPWGWEAECPAGLGWEMAQSISSLSSGQRRAERAGSGRRRRRTPVTRTPLVGGPELPTL